MGGKNQNPIFLVVCVLTDDFNIIINFDLWRHHCGLWGHRPRKEIYISSLKGFLME
jgi:hypothetical protein